MKNMIPKVKFYFLANAVSKIIRMVFLNYVNLMEVNLNK